MGKSQYGNCTPSNGSRRGVALVWAPRVQAHKWKPGFSRGHACVQPFFTGDWPRGLALPPNADADARVRTRRPSYRKPRSTVSD